MNQKTGETCHTGEGIDMILDTEEMLPPLFPEDV